jgi:acyl-CoA thioester hydrolase
VELLAWVEPVRPEWIDYNGHLSEAYYVLVFGHATDAVLEQIGLGEMARAANASSLFTVEAHVRYLDQVLPGEELEIRSGIIGSSAKKLHVWHEMWAAGRLRATEEVLGLHVDSTQGRATAFPDHVSGRIAGFLSAPPEHSGRRVST